MLIRSLLIVALLASGCASSADQQRARELETSLVELRTDLFYYKLSLYPPTPQTAAIEKSIDRHLDRALVQARHFSGHDE